MKYEDFIDACAKGLMNNNSTPYRDEPLASNMEDAREMVYETLQSFVEQSLAQVFDNIEDAREFLEDAGMDLEGMSNEELKEQEEILVTKDGKYIAILV